MADTFIPLQELTHMSFGRAKISFGRAQRLAKAGFLPLGWRWKNGKAGLFQSDLDECDRLLEESGKALERGTGQRGQPSLKRRADAIGLKKKEGKDEDPTLRP